jgi:hypothetical protein
MRILEVIPTNYGFIRATDTVDARVLAAGVEETHTIPTWNDAASVAHQANFVLFAANCDFYVRWDATVAVPAADVTDGTAGELNPTLRAVPAGVTTCHIISPQGGVVTMSWFAR